MVSTCVRPSLRPAGIWKLHNRICTSAKSNNEGKLPLTLILVTLILMKAYRLIDFCAKSHEIKHHEVRKYALGAVVLTVSVISIYSWYTPDIKLIEFIEIDTYHFFYSCGDSYHNSNAREDISSLPLRWQLP